METALIRYPVCICIFTSILLFLNTPCLQAQSCPPGGVTTINTFVNTYYPGVTASLPAGSSSISLGPVTYGATPINSGDVLLVIQMQGAQISAANDSTYGKGISGDGRVNGYLDNAQLLAGNMEYVIATNPVGLAGGTVNLAAATINDYANTDFGTDGQYRYQVIRVASYNNLVIGADIPAPAWNGTSGGVIVIYASGNIDMNGKTISAAAAGFRGGGGMGLTGEPGGSNTDFVTASTHAYNASKGEGIAGMPRYINDNNILLDNGPALEGYPGGSFSAGAPGNAGGGGTDGDPGNDNGDNSGGGGGSNGGVGGKGGNSFYSDLTVGGEPGAAFAQAAITRLVMGGGGGAGTTNNATGIPAGGIASSGAAGGGIVLLYAGSFSNTGTVDVSGGSANNTVGIDAGGGGGAGGTVVIYGGSGFAGITVYANGGNGGSDDGGGAPHGPGGGGGGGVIFANMPLNAASSALGGINGLTAWGIPYNAQPGTDGILIQNQVIFPPLSCVVLPVNFLYLSAIRNNNIQLNWQVSNEAGVQSYTVERSLNGIDFIPVATVDARPAGTGHYSYVDVPALTAGDLFYRVKANGNARYSTIAIVKGSVGSRDFFVTPNPANDLSNLTVTALGGGVATLRLMDISGRLIWQIYHPVNRGINIIRLQPLQVLHNGVYLLQYNDGYISRETKVVVRH